MASEIRILSFIVYFVGIGRRIYACTVCMYVCMYAFMYIMIDSMNMSYQPLRSV